MDELIRNLRAGDRVLDLGAGGGSFAYDSTEARVFSLDLDFPKSAQESSGRVLGDSRRLPFRARSFDVVISNHTLEHFEQPKLAVAEIDRVLKSNGKVWIAVPNGFGLDDALYRFVFKGGGHVNRFSLDSLVRWVEQETLLRAMRYKPLYTGFVFLNPPNPDKLEYYPERATLLARLPRGLHYWMLRWLNWGVRVVDRWTGTSLSIYGFGVVFKSRGGMRSPTPCKKTLERQPSDRNVCYSCGAGLPQETLRPLLERRFLWRSYACPLCGTRNLYAK